MTQVVAVPVRRPRKRRINTCFYEEDLALMDACARLLDCSRAEFLEYCFRYWSANNEDLIELAKSRKGVGGDGPRPL